SQPRRRRAHGHLLPGAALFSVGLGNLWSRDGETVPRFRALRPISTLQDRWVEHHSSQRRAVPGSANSSLQIGQVHDGITQPLRHYAAVVRPAGPPAPRSFVELARQKYTSTPLASTSVP